MRAHLRGLSVLALVAWAGGFEVAAAMHVGLHELWAPHHHDEHDDHGDDHHEEEDPDHGAGSVAHHGVATLGALVWVFVPPPRTASPVEPAPPPALHPSLRAVAPRSRGPPPRSFV